MVVSGCDWLLMIVPGCESLLMIVTGCTFFFTGCDCLLLVASVCASLGRTHHLLSNHYLIMVYSGYFVRY